MIHPPKSFPIGYGYFVLVGEVRHDFRGKNARKDAHKFYNRQVFLSQEPPQPPPLTPEDLLRELKGTFEDIQIYSPEGTEISGWAEEAIEKIKEFLGD